MTICKIGKWEYDEEQPNDCMGCGLLHNGLWYFPIKIGKVSFVINLCSKCGMELIKEREKESGATKRGVKP